jgi:ATP-binding protein involved in chromosome partitioning
MEKQKEMNQDLKRDAEEKELKQRLSAIKHKVFVLSGKGGVGKSTVAVNVAVLLAFQGKKVGLLDIDIHGPNVPKMLGVEGRHVSGTENNLNPYEYMPNLKLMSVAFLLPESDSAVIWRGPLKMHIIEQFLRDVNWGELDYLVVDAPPGTGDEPLSICQLVPDADGAVIVTTPQEVSVLDVRKCITFCRQVKTPVLGVVENMSGFTCPHCGEKVNLFKSGGGEKMAKEMGVAYLGSIPIDPAIVEGGDAGRPVASLYADSPTKRAFMEVVRQIIERTDKK